MPSIDIVVRSEIEKTARVRQLGAMFDVPLQDVTKLEWHGSLPIEDDDWRIGLIVGPSGSGKTTIANQLFGAHVPLEWREHRTNLKRLSICRIQHDTRLDAFV